GIAYRVESTVVEVDKGSAAADAGLQANDVIVGIRFRGDPDRRHSEGEWTSWFDMSSDRGPGRGEVYDQWPYHFSNILQQWFYREVEVKVKRGDKVLDPIKLTAAEDANWPQDINGVRFVPDTRKQQAHSLGEALGFGFDHTKKSIKQIYTSLR